MFPEVQMATSLRIAKYATWQGFTVRLEPAGVWRGAPYVSHWYLLYPLSLLVRRLKGGHDWRVVLLQGDEVIDERECQDRTAGAALALQLLRERAGGR